MQASAVRRRMPSSSMARSTCSAVDSIERITPVPLQCGQGWVEASTQPCPHCNGTGVIRSIESTALHVLRAIEEEGMRRRSAEIGVTVPPRVALYVLNQKRAAVQLAESRFGFKVMIDSDDTLVPPAFRLERLRVLTPAEIAALPIFVPPPPEPDDEDEAIADED